MLPIFVKNIIKFDIYNYSSKISYLLSFEDPKLKKMPIVYENHLTFDNASWAKLFFIIYIYKTMSYIVKNGYFK